MKLTLKPCLKCKKEVFRHSKVERKDSKNKAETGFEPRSWKSDHTLEIRVPPQRPELFRRPTGDAGVGALEWHAKKPAI